MTSGKIKTLIGTAIWNEGDKFLELADKMRAFLEEQRANSEVEFQFLVVDDGSDDFDFENLITRYPFIWYRHEKNLGAGASVRAIYRIAAETKSEIAVTIAGNGKDDPQEIPALIEPIIKKGYDLVQGSRYLPGGAFEGTPLYRILATRYVHPKLLSLFTGASITDSTNGFRAVRTAMLNDPAIKLDQQWLDRYELEPYLLYKAISNGHGVTEVPVKKTYPPSGVSYTKMKLLTGWWSILRPLFLLWLGLRK